MKKYIIPIIIALTLIGCKSEENTGASSKAVTGLDLATFFAWPAGEVQTVDAEAYGQNNLVFVVDRSGSMGDNACGSKGSKSDVAIQALSTFIPLIPDDVAVGWIDFGGRHKIVVPIGLNNRANLMGAAQAHKPDMGNTNVGAATRTAFSMLADQALTQGSTGTYRIVLIVDGGASDGSGLRSVLTEINGTPVEVLTAGFCIGSNHILNQPGETVYVEASSVDELVAVLTAAVQAESADFTSGFTGVTE